MLVDILILLVLALPCSLGVKKLVRAAKGKEKCGYKGGMYD